MFWENGVVSYHQTRTCIANNLNLILVCETAQVYDNGVAGIHITGSNNFTFEATIDSECYGDPCVLEGEGYVGNLDGQQPIEIIIESSSLVTFQDMKVQSVNGQSPFVCKHFSPAPCVLRVPHSITFFPSGESQGNPTVFRLTRVENVYDSNSYGSEKIVKIPRYAWCLPRLRSAT